MTRPSGRDAGQPFGGVLDLGPGGMRPILVIGVLSSLRAISLVLIAESLATSIAALAVGGIDSSAPVWRGALLLGALGALLRASTSWAVPFVAAREAVAAKSRLRRALADDIVRGGAAGRDSGSTAVLATSGLDELDQYYGTVIPSAISAVVVPLVLGARILSVDWLSALIVALTIPLIPAFMILIGMHTRERADAAASSLARLSDHLVELATGLPVLVGLGRVDEQTAALDGVQREWRERTSRMLRTAFLSALALELIATLSVAVVAVVLGLRLLNGSIGLDVALLVLLLAPDCFSALREVGTAFHSAQDGRAALRRARELLGAGGTTRALVSGPVVAVRGLTVRYEGRPDTVLHQLDMVFPRSTITAVTASSGAGKSTLLAVLAGTLDRSASVTGEVSGLDPERIAFVPQAPAFFGATVGEEVELWAGPASRALRDLGLAGMATRQISELSPGEQRRLAIARAMVRVEGGATLVLLDEPTAHLDAGNAHEVRSAIRAMRERAAVVLVSHDAATVGIAQRVIALDGRLGGASSALPASSESPAAAPDTLDTNQPHEHATTAPAPLPVAAPQPETQETGVLRALLAPARGRWALAILLGVVATGFGLALTAVSAWLIVRAGEHPNITYLSVAIVGVRFFGLGRSVARYAERLVTHTALFAATDALRLRVWRSIAARGAGSRRLLEGGSAIDYLVTSIDQLRELVPRVVTPLIVGVLSIAGVIVTVVLVDPAAAPLVGVVLGLSLVGVPLIAARADRSFGSRDVSSTTRGRLTLSSDRASGANAHRVDARALLVRRTVALVDAAPDLRANGLAERAIARVVAADAALSADDRRAARSAGLGAALLSLVTAGLAVLVPALTGAGLLAGTAGAAAAVAAGGLGGRVTAESVAVVALLVLASADPLTEVLRTSQKLPALRSVLARLRPFASEPAAPQTGGSRPPAAIRRLELDHLTAHWPEADRPVFTELTTTVESGGWLVVDGPSGSGKSTLLSILLGAVSEAAGEVRANGLSRSRISDDDWRRRVAWCPQDAHVFDSTIRGNLLLGRPRTDPVRDDEMYEVLARVGLSELLTRLPEGLDTRVGAAGGSLSGGERQRLAVGRALLGRSELLLLDEPTAHLDAATAAAMMSDLRVATRDRIVVLVTHRAADRQPGDRVVHLGLGPALASRDAPTADTPLVSRA